MPWAMASETRSAKASLPGWPMMTMHCGLAASASRNCASMVSACQLEYCSISLTPSASAAALAPLVRGSTGGSPGWPPICM